MASPKSEHRGAPLALSARMERELTDLTWLDGDQEDEIRWASQTDACVLISGESGVGKRLAADMIHQWSDRRSKPFTVVNSADVEPHLLHYPPGGTLLVQEIENVSAFGQWQLQQFLDRGAAARRRLRLIAATSVH